MDTITCQGFEAAGVAAGIKTNGKMDLGMIYSKVPAVAAGVFTRNKVKAAPVLLDQLRLKQGRCRAVVANSGNANCFTGAKGMVHAKIMARSMAEGLSLPEEEVMVASTGVIGQPLPIEKIEAAAPTLIKSLSFTGFEDFATSIMTTDTVPKLSSRKGLFGDKCYSIVAAIKGAGMIRPDMATLLCFICTDAAVENPFLQEALNSAVDRTLNRITIDGDTSTNDMALLLANGESGAVLKTADHRQEFQVLLDDLLLDLARQVVRDGEGVTKTVDVRIQGAATWEDAEKIADAIAHSPLVKTAFFGQDANWGRIIAAAGRAGAKMDPDRVDLYFDQIQMVEKGLYCGSKAEEMASAVLKKPEFTMTLDLNMGNAKTWILTCDFSVDYVKINADYRS